MHVPTLPAKGNINCSTIEILQLLIFLHHRLKQSLNLPKIEPRPPCPPRIYNKLYSYFDNLLVPPKKRGRPPNATSNPSTPSKVQKTLPTRPTPTKASSLTPYRTTPSRPARRGLQFADTTTDIPSWIHPTIRAMCKTLQAEGAAPHILAGVTTVLTLPSPASISATTEASERKDKKDKLPALLAAVNFFVGTRLSGRETSGKEYTAQRADVLRTLKELRDDPTLQEKLLQARQGKGKRPQNTGNDAEAVWEGWEPVGSKDVDAWLLEISTQGWLKLDWFTNIVEGAGLQRRAIGENDDDELDGASDAEDELEESGSGALRTGLGTMMQDRVDYLSEKKRKEYMVWKQGIIARIEEIELSGGQQSVANG